jgi:ribosomal protein L32
MTLLNSDGLIDVEKLEAVKAELKEIGHLVVSEASMNCMRDDMKKLRDELSEHGDYAECERCGEFTEIWAHDMCDCCAHDMGAA